MRSPIPLMPAVFTRDSIPFEADQHPDIEANEVEVTHVFIFNETLVIVVMWDGGYDAPWNEVHSVLLEPETKLAIQNLEPTQKLHISWTALEETRDHDEGTVDYAPTVLIPQA